MKINFSMRVNLRKFKILYIIPKREEKKFFFPCPSSELFNRGVKLVLLKKPHIRTKYYVKKLLLRFVGKYAIYLKVFLELTLPSVYLCRYLYADQKILQAEELTIFFFFTLGKKIFKYIYEIEKWKTRKYNP